MTPTVVRAADFTGSIGVQAKLNYTDGGYRNIDNVLADLDYIGVSLIRAASLNAAGTPGGQNNYQVAARAGVRFDLVVNGNAPIGSTVSQIDAFEAANPGAVYAIEGPNEVDHYPITYNGLTGGAAAVAYQNALYAAVEADPLLAPKNVYSFSLGSGATPTGGYDYVASHPYPPRGAQPLASILGNLGIAPAGATSVLSETGYPTLPADDDGVDPLTQAKLVLDDVFDAIRAGVKTVYLYELLDAYADPSGTDPEKHFGLFDIANQPKPLAAALHNLSLILADTSPAAATFATANLAWSVTGAPATGSSLVLEKASGTYDLVVWNEPQVWDYTTHSPLVTSSTVETIRLGGVAASIKVYDPLIGAGAIKTAYNASSIAVRVTDHPLIVEINGLIQAPVVAPSGDIFGTSSGDQLVGSALDDRIYARGGNDVVFAGAGDDLITVGAGLLQIDGGAGFDTLSLDGLSSGAKVYMGVTGLQTLNTTTRAIISGVEAISGSPFADTFLDSPGDDTMSGAAGNDTFTTTGGHDVIDGGSGVDTVSFASASDGITVSALASAAQALDANGWSVQLSNVENLNGSAFDDVLAAGTGDATLNGGLGDDTLVGGAGADKLNGGSGEDTASYAAATGAITVSLGSWLAQNTGGAGKDTFVSIEDLIGSPFADALTGSVGANRIDGGAGNDAISGAGGADTLIGGAGADRFILKATSDSAGPYDTILDFSSAAGDKIDVSALDANVSQAGNNTFALVAAFTGSAGQLTITSEPSGYLVQGDVNGDSTADFGIHVYTAVPLIGSDFIF